MCNINDKKEVPIYPGFIFIKNCFLYIDGCFDIELTVFNHLIKP